MLDTTSNQGWSQLLFLSVVVCLLFKVFGASLVWILRRQLFVLLLLSGREKPPSARMCVPSGLLNVYV